MPYFAHDLAFRWYPRIFISPEDRLGKTAKYLYRIIKTNKKHSNLKSQIFQEAWAQEARVSQISECHLELAFEKEAEGVRNIFLASQNALVAAKWNVKPVVLQEAIGKALGYEDLRNPLVVTVIYQALLDGRDDILNELGLSKINELNTCFDDVSLELRLAGLHSGYYGKVCPMKTKVMFDEANKGWRIKVIGGILDFSYSKLLHPSPRAAACWGIAESIWNFGLRGWNSFMRYHTTYESDHGFDADEAGLDWAKDGRQVFYEKHFRELEKWIFGVNLSGKVTER